MSIFTKIVVDESAVEKAKLVHKLEKGKLNKEITSLHAKISSRESKIDVLESRIKDVEAERNYYKNLENDRDIIEREKKVIKIEKSDLEEDRKELEHREQRMSKRVARLEAEENDEYKKGYSDGLADGLRKAHDITREDRKYMTMIAMSTNQSKAIETSVKALEGGFNDGTNSEGSNTTG